MISLKDQDEREGVGLWRSVNSTMRLFLFILFVKVPSLSSIADVDVETIDSCKVEKYNGIYFIPGNILGPHRGIFVDDFDDCVRKCSGSSNCKSINFLTALRFCTLQSQGFADENNEDFVAFTASVHAVLTCGIVQHYPEQVLASSVSKKITNVNIRVGSDGKVKVTGNGKASVTVDNRSYRNPITKIGDKIASRVNKNKNTKAIVKPRTEFVTPQAKPKMAKTTVDCGIPAEGHKPRLRNGQRIIGGFEAQPHSWPWSSVLQVDMGKGKTSKCGSNVLRVKAGVDKSDVLLTAAHCVTRSETQATRPRPYSPRQIMVRAGKHRLGITEKGEQFRIVTAIRFHGGFRFTPEAGAINDLALVKVAPPIRFSTTVRPICLPSQADPLPIKRTCVTTGWGRTNSLSETSSAVLKQLLSPVHSARVCKEAWLSKNGSMTRFKEEQMICAGSLNGESGTCLGDSGGALACQRPDGAWSMYGATSFVPGERCIKAGKAAVFARISRYVNWINKNMKQLTSL